MPEVEYVHCPLCANTRALTGKRAWRGEPFTISPTDFYVYSVRRQEGGKGAGGFFNVSGKERNIAQLYFSENPEHKEIAEALKLRLVSLVKAWLSVGVLNLEDLK